MLRTLRDAIRRIDSCVKPLDEFHVWLLVSVSVEVYRGHVRRVFKGKENVQYLVLKGIISRVVMNISLDVDEPCLSFDEYRSSFIFFWPCPKVRNCVMNTVQNLISEMIDVRLSRNQGFRFFGPGVFGDTVLFPYFT